MKKFERFGIDRCALHGNQISLWYDLDDDVKFLETLTFEQPYPQSPSPAVDAAVHCLHILGGISYYKTCIPKLIDVRSGFLTKDQSDFFEAVYENGLMEFFYKNKIDFRGLIHFTSTPHPPSPPEKGETRGKRKILVPIGGGKDSIVTVELLRKAGYDVTLFRIGAHPFIDAFAKARGLPLLTVQRQLSPLLFDMNAEGALNGHVPITAYLSCLSVITALLHGFDAVAFSNERSSSYGNTELFGKEVNHQWSKSIDFEKLFQKYMSENITNDVSYFSLLRPLSELHIAKLFSQYPQYFDLATSCNENWKIKKNSQLATRNSQLSKWCCVCPKCAFSFALFSPYIPKDQLVSMFGKNLFEDSALLPLYRELLGLEGIKPFECVGTPEEAKAALYLAHQSKSFAGTAVMQMFEKEVLPSLKNPEKLVEECMTLSNEDAIPEEFKNIIKEINL